LKKKVLPSSACCDLQIHIYCIENFLTPCIKVTEILDQLSNYQLVKASAALRWENAYSLEVRALASV
jgi:hypothetical protein